MTETETDAAWLTDDTHSHSAGSAPRCRWLATSG